MATFRRIVQVFFVVMFHLTAHLGLHVAGKYPWLGNRLRDRWSLRSGPERLKHALETLGGSFVKLGQLLALQPDILPMEYCRALYSLLDRVKPIPFEQISQVFQEELGLGFDDAFDEFNNQSIASGSIGQVYIARYRGRKVAVKVQRPDTISGFERDIRLMETVAWVIEKLKIRPLEWMIAPLTEFAGWTIEELDFRVEARYMQQMRQNSKRNSIERIPGIVHRMTTRRVLVIEFLDGVTLLDHMRLTRSRDKEHQSFLEEIDFDADAFATNIIDNFLGDSFQHGVFHSDLHPANLMILGKDSRLAPNCVGYLDFGIVGVISPFSRKNLVAITLAYARRDLESLCESFFEVSSITEESRPEVFRQGIQELAQRWYQGNQDDPKLKTTTTIVMLDMLKLSRKSKIWPQRDVIKYIRSAIAIDGLVRQFAPEFDVGTHLAEACKRYLAAHAREKMMSHDSMINWAIASTELMKNGAFRVSNLFEKFSRNEGQDHAVSKPTLGTSIPLLALVLGLMILLVRPTSEQTLPLLVSTLIACGIVFRPRLHLERG